MTKEIPNRILVLGNGFDLAHSLPTAYIHFMEAMNSILDSQKDTLRFDDLFSKSLNNDDVFFKKTKELYRVEEFILDKEQVADFRTQLQANSWFNYFQKHLNDIDTWIDFESEMKFVLDCFVEIFEKNIPVNHNFFNSYFQDENFGSKAVLYQYLFLDTKILLEKKRETKRSRNTVILRTNKVLEMASSTYLKRHGEYILGLDGSNILGFLAKELDDFNMIFSRYLNEIIHHLDPKTEFQEFKELENVEAVYTFNYTNTFERFYPQITANVEHLHGASEVNNIVLGVDKLSEGLEQLNAFKFTKAHQKIRHNTDYRFIDSDTEDLTVGNYEIIVFGHSLDISDKEYIENMFKLFEKQTDYIAGVDIRLKVLYHEDQSSVLSNLMKTMGQDVVSHYCKNNKLTFEEKPEITQTHQNTDN